jgi:hypothetical protein
MSVPVKPARLAIGVGFCPFDWRIGDVSFPLWGQRMWALGPLRFSWRGWR